MVVKYDQASYETYVNAGTNFDGHTFTAEDIGKILDKLYGGKMMSW